ncbi:FxLD family lanthipeptide [Streptomonospora salina]|uniref:FxLD family lantipeptide n=1 Tax=Streptomonospora salina TaxID=104205 RepID=A0A841E888_9ACTN|nr:FxLD family lanthipeptide [Streptomonospora salina]MBB6000177.1 FxLD family lantipeptide [Streptomonospora salina]
MKLDVIETPNGFTPVSEIGPDTQGDPFDLDLQVHVPAQSGALWSMTDDGCDPTCESACSPSCTDNGN